MPDPGRINLAELRDFLVEGGEGRYRMIPKATAFALVEAAETLQRVRDNARSWHGPPPDDSGHVRALAVIAQWCDDALARFDFGEPS